MRKVLLLAIMIMTTGGLWAQNTRETTLSSGIVFSIRYQNKQVYYPQSKIVLRASIKNLSPQDYVFELADDPFFNVDLKVRTLTNLALNDSDVYIRRTQSNETRPVLYRLMSLKSGEEHSFELTLNDYVDIDEASTYVIQAAFRPKANLNLNRTVSYNVAGETLTANSLSLTVRPYVADRSFQDIIDLETNETLKQQNLSPDQIISYALAARQKHQWEKFFLYLNMEELFLTNADRSRRYSYADVQTKAQMLDDYKKQLMNETIDGALATIPTEFKVLKTTYTEDRAEVITRQVYRQRQYDDVKEYKWLLRRDNDTGIWLIYDYQVTNLGSEKQMN